MNLSIIIPAYNEQQAIGGVLHDLNGHICKNGLVCEIIVVDDGSIDDTAKIVRGITGVTLIQHPVNKGYGASLKTGIHNANGEYILIMDSDDTYPVEEIPKLLLYMDNYDMVVGARTGKNAKIPLIRKPAKFFLSKLANYVTDYKIPDLNSGLRIFRKDICERFLGILSSGFSFTTTITLALLSSGYNIKYVPIEYVHRKGNSKIHPIKDTINFTLLILRVITYFNPIKVFFPFGLLLILIGLGWLIFTLATMQNITSTSILTILSGLQIIFIGMVADIIIKTKMIK